MLLSMNAPRVPKTVVSSSVVKPHAPLLSAMLTTSPLEPRWKTKNPNTAEKTSPVRIPASAPT